MLLKGGTGYMKANENVETQFQEALQQKNEQTIEQQKKVLKDRTAATRVQAEQAGLNEQMLDDIENAEDTVAKLKKQILRKQFLFGILFVLCVIVAVARYTAWIL